MRQRNNQMNNVLVSGANVVYAPTMERRSAMRYSIVVNARYQGFNKRSNYGGVGKTVNMSSGGFLIASEHHVPVGVRLEVMVEWPALLDGTIELLLVANGRVVRAREGSFALAFSQYEFRTTRRKLQSSRGSVIGNYAAPTGMEASETSTVPTATARFRVPKLLT